MRSLHSVNQSRITQPRSGLAALELALLLPLILLIVIGCIDFGRFAHSYIGVTNSARAGAGYAHMHPPTVGTMSLWQANIRQIALDELTQTLPASGLTANDVTVNSTRVFDQQNNTTFWRAEVTVSMPFRTIIAWPTLPANVTMTRTVKFRGIR